MSDILDRRMQLLAFALETQRLALSNWDNAVPWRYLRWRRVQREIKKRHAWFHAERAAINRDAES